MAIGVPRFVAILLSVTAIGCGTNHVSVEYFGARDHSFSLSEQRAIQHVANATASEVRRYLPALPQKLVLQVRPGTDVISETGETGTAVAPDVVVWTVDPNRRGGVLAVVNTQLRASLYHEFHHLVRGATTKSVTLMDHVITEGMATVFERDFAGTQPPWGQYPDNVSEWVKELTALPATARREHWLYNHPDGRRWIGLRAGTFLADQAIGRSGRSSAELVSVSTEDVLAMTTERN